MSDELYYNINRSCERIESLPQSDFLNTISLQPNIKELRYFKLWIL